MNVYLTEGGPALADSQVESYVDRMLANREDIFTGQFLVVDCLRARLIKMPVADRPEVRWVFYDREVHFDDDLRSRDAYRHPLTDLTSKFLNVIIAEG
jgi:hypothetical protein